MECRPGCAACCIAISISSPIPGMPDGKPAGMRCPHLSEDGLCIIHDSEDYPKVCRNFKAEHTMCGDTDEEALRNLTLLEALTAPGKS